jgi:hypothetical protein
LFLTYEGTDKSMNILPNSDSNTKFCYYRNQSMGFPQENFVKQVYFLIKKV